ncbi:MAG: hypothetical protein IT164_02465 [Bryobacterales bacterium]|nr:hypothetical protein [Bryobacterales bacterium]
MFNSSAFLPDSLIVRLTDTRVNDPEFSWRAAQARVRRPKLAPAGKLNILAADHPARRVTKVGDDPLAMASRRDYLARIVRVLQSGRVDGVMATMDLIEDLLAMDGLLKERGARPMLDNKVLLGSLNRGGLAGASWEMDDPVTGPTSATCHAWKLDGTKLLMRVEDNEAASLKTMLACAQEITAANALGLPTFLEPLPVNRTDKGYVVVKEKGALAKLAGVASALGDSSRLLWLKLPYCEGYEVVARSTTLPILLLGGESAGDPSPFLRQLGSALQAGPSVRGALVGRNVLYPGGEDPLAMAEAAGGIVHEGWSVEEALQSMAGVRGSALDGVSRYFPA